MHRVSIVITTFNRAKMLLSAIKGALDQTYKDFELLVLDNASTDETNELIKQFKDPRLVYIRRAVNGGSAANWTEAMKRAIGEFVLVTHDDDYLHPEIVMQEVEAMDRYPQAMMVGSNVRTIDVHGNEIQGRANPSRKNHVFKQGQYIMAYMDDRFVIPCPTQMIRRKGSLAIEKLRQKIANTKNPESVGPIGDIYTVCRCNAFGWVVWLEEPLLDYRIHPGQESLTLDITPSDIAMHEAVLSLCQQNHLQRCIPSIKASLLRHLVLQKLLQGKTPKKMLRELGEIERDNPKSYSMPVWPDGRARTLRGQKVAIFGSLLNAFLLAEECLASGVKVTSFLDNNPKRQHKRLDGIMVHSPDWLLHHQVDAVLISNEKRSKDQIEPGLRLLTDAKIIHWKELCDDTWP